MEEIVYAPDYNEDRLSDEDEDECFEPPAKQKRGANRKWKKTDEFQSKEDAEKAISSIWKKASQKTTVEGLKIEYRCSGGQYRTNECPARLYLLFHCTSMRVSLFRCDADHANHSDVPKRGLSAEDKLFIREKYDEGIQKPNALIDLFRLKEKTEPDKSKLITFLRALRYVPNDIIFVLLL